MPRSKKMEATRRRGRAERATRARRQSEANIRTAETSIIERPQTMSTRPQAMMSANLPTSLVSREVIQPAFVRS